jgi:hypothetical protein
LALKLSDNESRKDAGTRRLAARLALRGAVVGHTSAVSLEKPYCDNPVKVVRSTDPRNSRERTMQVELLVPCRKCAKCLQFRQMKWRQLAMTEIQRAKRTWFVTLTFSPVHLAGIISESMSFRPQLDEAAAIDRAAYRHLQRYFKRLRKLMPDFRYLAVFELGEKTGRPHYHLLMHEAKRPLVKIWLDEQWRSHVHAKLVAEDACDGSASYITKYATKSASVRLRSSQRYGAALLVKKER